MEIKLNLPSGANQQELLDFLNSGLRGKMRSSSGSSMTDAQGHFISSVRGSFPLEARELDLAWSITKDQNGNLLSIEVNPVDPTEFTQYDWQLEAQKFINEVLSSVIAEKKESFFQRTTLYYVGEQLDGEYWLPGFRFAPAFPNDPEPFLINAERPVVIDQTISAIDKHHAMSLAEESAKRLSARLSLLLNTAIYQNSHLQKWVYPDTKSTSEQTCERRQCGYYSQDPIPESMPKKRELCQLGSYSGDLSAQYKEVGKLLSLPKEARRILRCIDEQGSELANAFDCCARLYQVALVCGRQFPSVGLSYRVAAIEAACSAEPKSCSFSEFMRKYVYSATPGNDVLDYLYGDIRSAHFHAGKFPHGEFERKGFFDPFMDSDETKRDSLHRHCYDITREALVNWIYSKIPQYTEHSTQK